MNDRIANVMEAIREDLESDADGQEKLEKLQKILSDEAIVERCLKAVYELFEEHGIK
jgi:predicted ArsR family transcriptional regulator